MTAIPLLIVACVTEGSTSKSADEGVAPTSTAPIAIASRPLPTLNETAGGYFNLTFDEAQQLVPFDLVMPSPIPPAFDFVGAGVQLPPEFVSPEGTPYPEGTTKWGPPDEVGFGFQPVSGEEQALTFYESTGGRDRCPESPGSPLTIDDMQVRKYVREDAPGGTLVIYCWETQGLKYNLAAIVSPDLSITERDLEELIAATAGQ